MKLTKDAEAVAHSSVDCWGSYLNKRGQMILRRRRTRQVK